MADHVYEFQEVICMRCNATAKYREQHGDKAKPGTLLTALKISLEEAKRRFKHNNTVKEVG